MRSFRFLLPVLLALTACDTTASLSELRNAAPAKTPYNRYLATLYQAYAEQELANYDWWSSKYFADKGMLVAYGKLVLPEDPKHWGIAPSFMAALTEARGKLIKALDAGAAAAHPKEAAQAMAAYDCWVEQQEEEWKLERIDACRDDFFAALTAMTAPEKLPDAPKETKKKPVETTSSILYFPFDSDALAPQGQEILEQLIAYVLSAGKVDVVINGHADRAGSDAYNLALSERRARFVQSSLVEAGVDPNLIQYFAFGESDPQLPTADDVKEPANRRVEIFVE
jgi:OOP family OmpA-OmpF porin